MTRLQTKTILKFRWNCDLDSQTVVHNIQTYAFRTVIDLSLKVVMSTNERERVS